MDEGTQHFYQSGHRIHFFDMRVAEFVSQLRARVDSDEGALLAAMAVAPDAPSVFLCHASEDKAFADNLAKRLKARGIKTWLDKDNLRGGSEWDEVIERTVERDVAYFIVLQSEPLKNKRQQRAYVNKEIKLALEVQDQYVDPRRFLIPIVIDDQANRLPDLDHLHAIDMTPSNDSDGFEALVSELHRDMERERKQSA
jgi:hypothetical protein